ncbi:MAG: zinc-dependent metalloprotease [Gammaproteobacteria bacterium]|nr:zinc-dependent metalloprotease [Gammaproteobacteria bacterium]
MNMGIGALALGGLWLAASPVLAASYAELTKGTQAQPGLLDVYRDQAKGRVLLGVDELDTPLLMLSSLPYGLGSNDVGLDRGQGGEPRLVEFRRIGKRLLLVQPNTRFRALSDAPEERAAVREAFAESVLWAGEILAEEKGGFLVDFTPFLLADRHGIAARLAGSKQGAYAVDKERSAPLLEHAKSFPDNTELEALLSFAGPGEGEFVQQVAMDATSLSLRQHLSFVRLPKEGFQPRPYHPASGGFDLSFYDFATPLAASLDTRYQARFRLDKTEPGAAPSPVKKPIVFYLDRGTPEPVRSALLDGARWWEKAFEAAGFQDAYRVELLPEGVDPMDIRYNTIQWVHRATRGWSYGAFVADPRTGEILKGAVTLGSQRVRQDILIAESLLAPYGKPDEAALKAAAEAMALARLRQLAAHEVGHTLGFAHNFASSRGGNGSVMDYPHPLIRVDAQGRPQLAEAYGVGLGPWDRFAVKHAYGQFPAGQEATGLAALRAQAARDGLGYVSDADARGPGDAHPDGLLWDFGPDSVASFDALMGLRRTALAGFSTAVLPPERQLGELEARLAPVYLLHRYQLEAVARLMGGASYRYGLAGDTPAGTQSVPPERQRAALQRVLAALSAEELALPEHVLKLMTPPAYGHARGREYFATKTAPLFDALAAVESAAAQASQYLLDPARLNRLAWQEAADPAQLGLGETLDALFDGTWGREPDSLPAPGGAAVQLAANWVVLDGLLGLLDGHELHAPAEAQLRQRLARWAKQLERQDGEGLWGDNAREAAAAINLALREPGRYKPRAKPAIPPGAPI